MSSNLPVRCGAGHRGSAAPYAPWIALAPIGLHHRTMSRADGDFPIDPPVEPMLAALADSLPEAGDFLFEPKWDGFRAIVFRGGGADLYIQSRDSRPLDR